MNPISLFSPTGTIRELSKPLLKYGAKALYDINDNVMYDDDPEIPILSTDAFVNLGEDLKDTGTNFARELLGMPPTQKGVQLRYYNNPEGQNYGSAHSTENFKLFGRPIPVDNRVYINKGGMPSDIHEIATLNHEFDHIKNFENWPQDFWQSMNTEDDRKAYFSQPGEISGRMAELEALNNIIQTYDKSKDMTENDYISRGQAINRFGVALSEIRPYYEQYKKKYPYDPRIKLVDSVLDKERLQREKVINMLGELPDEFRNEAKEYYNKLTPAEREALGI